MVSITTHIVRSGGRSIRLGSRGIGRKRRVDERSCSRVAVVSRGGTGAAGPKEGFLEKGHDLMVARQAKIAARAGWWLWCLYFVLYMWVGLCCVTWKKEVKLRSQ